MYYHFLTGNFIALQKEIPPAAWIALVLVVVFLIMLNYGLLAALKKKRSDNYDVILKASRAMRHPFEEENNQMSELSKRVAQFKQPTPEGPNEAVSTADEAGTKTP